MLVISLASSPSFQQPAIYRLLDLWLVHAGVLFAIIRNVSAAFLMALRYSLNIWEAKETYIGM